MVTSRVIDFVYFGGKLDANKSPDKTTYLHFVFSCGHKHNENVLRVRHNVHN